MILMLLPLRTASSEPVLTFLHTNDVSFYEHSIIQQVMINTKFLEIDPKFISDINAYLLAKTATATKDDKEYLSSCMAMMTEIKRLYDDMPKPFHIFTKKPEITEITIEYIQSAFILPNRLPIETLIKSTEKIDYNVLAFNLFRFYTLVKDEYAKYTNLLNGKVSLSVIKDGFKTITFPTTGEIKLKLISTGKFEDNILSIYSLEFLSKPMKISCFNVLDLGNFSFPEKSICEYNKSGVTFSGTPPMSPLNMVIKYNPEEYKSLRGSDIANILPFLVKTPKRAFSENLVGAVKFNNNLSNMNFTFPQGEEFSPFVTRKQMGVRIGEILMKFKSKLTKDQIQTNKNSDEKLRQLVDDAFDFLPDDVQLGLIIAGSALIILILVILVVIQCKKSMKTRRRKKREKSQLRTVNLLSLPLRQKPRRFD